MNILIVDDEELGRARLQRLLTTLGYVDVTLAKNGFEALEKIKASHFDLALLDINMPDITGLELAYELKALQNDISIIFQTAYDEHALEAFTIGANGYLVKPFSIEELKKAIERIITQQSIAEKSYLMSKNGKNYYMLKPEEIYYVKADLTEVMLRSQEGFSYYPQKISDVEKILTDHNFIQIHRSYLINIDKIKEMQSIEQSKIRFSFETISDTIESSKDGAKAFRKRFSS